MPVGVVVFPSLGGKNREQTLSSLAQSLEYNVRRPGAGELEQCDQSRLTRRPEVLSCGMHK